MPRSKASQSAQELLSLVPKRYLSVALLQVAGFRNRTRNALTAAGLVTLGDLAAFSDVDLLALPRLGLTSLADIKAVLREMRLRTPGESIQFEVARLVESLASETLRLPLASALALKERTRNALVRGHYLRIGDLGGVPDPDLLEVRGLGKESLADLTRALRDLTELVEDRHLEGTTVDELLESLALCRTFVEEVHYRLPPEADHRAWTILERRSFNAKPATLDLLGKRFGITRERVRQLEHRALAPLVGDGTLRDVFDRRAGRLRTERETPLRLVEAEELDPWLAGASADPEWMDGALRSLGCEHRVIDFGDGQEVLTLGRFPNRDAMLSAFLKFYGPYPEEVAPEAAAEKFLSNLGVTELLPLLLEDSRDCVRFRGYAYLEPTHASAVFQCLEEAGSPLHVREVMELVAQAGHPMSERAVRSTLERIDAIYTGPSTYTLRTHLSGYAPFALQAEQATLAIMRTDPARQWSSPDLLQEFVDQGLDWALEIPEPYILDYLLEGSDEIVGLGRRIFALQEHHAERVSVAELLRTVLVEAGTPLPHRDLVSRARRVRSLGVTTTICWPLVRLSDGRIGLGERDLGLDEPTFQAFVAKVRSTLAKTKERRISSATLAKLRDRICPKLFKSDPYGLASLVSANAKEIQLDRDGTALRHAHVEHRGGRLRPRRATL